MKIVVDTHTHTVASGHAYSTVQEMAREAAVNGIEMFAMTDHGPLMNGGPHIYHFANMRVIPGIISGVRILKGVEANIIDYDGKTDMPYEYLKRLDFANASLHDVCIRPSSVEENTRAFINVLKNPYIDAVSHPGNPMFQVDIEKVVKAAGENGKMIEINNQSFLVRKGCEENCKNFALMCKRYGVRVVCGSDAHISFDVGRFDNVKRLFDEIEMPEELVLSTSVKKFDDYLEKKKERLTREGYL